MRTAVAIVCAALGTIGCTGSSSHTRSTDAGVDSSARDASGQGGESGSIVPVDAHAGAPSDSAPRSDVAVDTGSTPLDAATGFSQPHDGSGTLYQSSGNGNDYDLYVWDDFTPASALSIGEVRFRGGYMIPPSYPSGPIQSFDISFWTTVADQPNIGAGEAKLYEALLVAETPAGTFGTTEMFDYAVTLPSTFQATAGTRYWIMIGAYQPGVPGWGIAAASGGDGQHFQSFVNYAGGTAYRFMSGNVAFDVLP